MLDRDQAARAIECHRDRVAPDHGRARAIGALAASMLPAILRTRPRLRWWIASNGVPSPRPIRLVLTSQNAERLTVVGDDVELAPAGAVVAVEDLEPAPDQVLGGQPLALVFRGGVGGRCSRASTLRDARVTRGQRTVTSSSQSPGRFWRRSWHGASPTPDTRWGVA